MMYEIEIEGDDGYRCGTENVAQAFILGALSGGATEINIREVQADD